MPFNILDILEPAREHTMRELQEKHKIKKKRIRRVGARRRRARPKEEKSTNAGGYDVDRAYIDTPA